jgi:hypothetical protein
MTADVTWREVAVRLALTLVSAGVVGVNRGGHSRPAGLRTTILKHRCGVIWMACPPEAEPPPFVDALAGLDGVIRFDWKPN